MSKYRIYGVEDANFREWVRLTKQVVPTERQFRGTFGISSYLAGELWEGIKPSAIRLFDLNVGNFLDTLEFLWDPPRSWDKFAIDHRQDARTFKKYLPVVLGLIQGELPDV